MYVDTWPSHTNHTHTTTNKHAMERTYQVKRLYKEVRGGAGARVTMRG
jgi:hypothetical protein